MEDLTLRTEDTITDFLNEAKAKCGHLPKHPQAHLYPYEVVAIGMLRAFRGGSFRSFYRWLKGDWDAVFSGPLPERTRLSRLLVHHFHNADAFLVEAESELICDSYGMEMVHPWRSERGRRRAAWKRRKKKRARQPATLARKGFSNRRWIIGTKIAVLIRCDGKVVDFAWDSANVHDSTFNFLAARHPDSRVLGDANYAQAVDQPQNLVLCKKGERSERMVVETVFSMLTLVSHTKRLWARTEQRIDAYLSYLVAMFNCVTGWTKGKLSLAEYSL